ncbi:MAG: carboxypeptidase-like regulatory domain-containing protein [Acidobacteriota bacterium]|nr:carboxypeptidase-like regulatory domain-containing protein [Acidobacteriota bacterium]
MKLISLQVDQRTDYVNVMGDEMPVSPAFPALSKKPGFVRGYVKNTVGQPIAGAKLGLKTARIYDGYAASSAETDAKGYYEIKIPLGGARFDYAGYAVKMGKGFAALSLHPADGKLDESMPASSGAVENFVMLPYGVGDAAAAANDPKYRANYYGGSLTVAYSIAPAGEDINDFPGMIAAGTEIEIILTPVNVLSDGNEFARAFSIRKKVEDSTYAEFFINNIPIARYQIEVRQSNGKSLRLRQKTPGNSVFGMQPVETSQSATLLFNPMSEKAESAVPTRGGWADLEITLQRQ